MNEIEDIIRKNKQKRDKYVGGEISSSKEELPKNLKYVKGLISRSLVAIIFVLCSIIFTNVSDKNKELYQKYVLEDSLEFTKINELYQSLFGKVDMTSKKDDDSSLVSGNITYTNIEPFKNGVKLTVGMNEVVNVITSGIVVFIGEKYDYIESGSILGTSNAEDIYITICKDGEYMSYEEYQASI